MSKLHSITPRIVCADTPAFLRFLEEVFGAVGERRDNAPATVTIGDSVILVSSTRDRDAFPAFLYVYVDDADGAYEKAVNAGALSIEPVWDTPYGERRGMVKDEWGNVWQIAARNG
jgi:uncharacterized glyoxalase superfamily protein PhnB